jgi:hypothetical protein
MADWQCNRRVTQGRNDCLKIKCFSDYTRVSQEADCFLGGVNFDMPKIVSGLLCIILIVMLGGSSGAAPNSADNEESECLKTFLKCSNEVMISSRGLEIHYKQIPASKIQISALKAGTPSNEIRKFLSSFARITIKNPIKTSSTVLQPGNYLLGLQEEKMGSGHWFFAVVEPNSGKQLTKLDPIFESLTPTLCARVMTMELDRRPGSNLLKIKMKWGDFSVSTRDALEL